MFEFDEVAFRGGFLEFSDDTQYPLPVLEQVFNNASSILTSARSVGELFLLTAHILKVRKNESNGEAEHVVSSSANGESIAILPQTFRNNFERFLYSSSYGKELATILMLRAFSEPIYIR